MRRVVRQVSPQWTAQTFRAFSTSLPPSLSSVRPLLVKDALEQGSEYLTKIKQAKKDDTTISHASEAFSTKVVMSHILGIGSRLEFTAKERNCLLDEKQVVSYTHLLERVGKGEPLQYVIGEWSFGDLDLLISPDVLIPRSDSEVIIEAIEKVYQDKENPLTIMDIGVGSGCLLLSALKKYPNARGIAVDISPRALEVARKNAIKLDLEKRTSFICLPMQSLLMQLKEEHPSQLFKAQLQSILRTDVLISNPPYIRTQDIPNLQTEVKDFEPTIALDGGSDGLKFYYILADIFRKIVDSNPTSHAFFEIGYNQLHDVTDILLERKLSVFSVHKDLSSIDRCIVAHKK